MKYNWNIPLSLTMTLSRVLTLSHVIKLSRVITIERLFTLDDIINCIELWRNTHARNVFLAIQEVFLDMDDSFLSEFCDKDSDNEVEIVEEEEWQNIRDDNSRADLFTEFKFSDLSKITREDSQNESHDLEMASASAVIEEAMLL